MIQLEDLTKSVRRRSRCSTDVCLEVPDGQNTVIIGYSGSGKSVTLKCIVGLLEPDAGRVVGGWRDRAGDGPRPAGRAPGHDRLRLSVRGAVRLDDGGGEHPARSRAPWRTTRTTIRERIEESLAVVELSGTEPKYPAELSGGMRKRVGIARAIALKPRYILYDEPTTGLDPVTSAVMDQLMIRTRDLGVTGLVVTHDMRSAFTVGDRDRHAVPGRHPAGRNASRRSGRPTTRWCGSSSRDARPRRRRRRRGGPKNETEQRIRGRTRGPRGPRARDRRRAVAERDGREPEAGNLRGTLPDRRRTRCRGAGHAARREGRAGGGDPPGRGRVGGDRVQHRPRRRAAAQAGGDLHRGQPVRGMEREHRSLRAAADRSQPPARPHRIGCRRRRRLARRDPARHRPAHRPGQPHRR